MRGRSDRENVLGQAENLEDYSHPLLLPGIKANTSPTNQYASPVWLQRFDGEKWVRSGSC
jgi:branched-chain amino acid transport system substrate-binding protein